MLGPTLSIKLYSAEIDSKFTLCILMDPSIWFDTINLGLSIVHTKGCQVIIVFLNCILLSKDLFYLHKQCRP